MNYPHQELTEKIIGCFYTVYNTLGYGFLEKVYERAMMIELRLAGLDPVNQQPVTVYYQGQIVGEYSSDIMVNRVVICELKTAATIIPEYSCQLINYLKSTPVEVGLILNFGPTPQIQRRIFSNDRKKWIAAQA